MTRTNQEELTILHDMTSDVLFLWLSAFRPTRPPWVVVGASSSQHARSALAGAIPDGIGKKQTSQRTEFLQ